MKGISMNPFVVLLGLLIIVPLIELYLLIKVGVIIGAWSTVGLVIFTAVLGAFLLRLQGFSTLRQIQGTLQQGGIPAIEILEGALLLISGAFLLTPGFFTDSIGFLILIPPLRRLFVLKLIARFFQPRYPGGGSGGHHGHYQQTIEGEFRREDD